MVYCVLNFPNKCQQFFYHWHIFSCEKTETKRSLMFGAGNENAWQKKLYVYTENSAVASLYNPEGIRGGRRDKYSSLRWIFAQILFPFEMLTPNQIDHIKFQKLNTYWYILYLRAFSNAITKWKPRLFAEKECRACTSEQAPTKKHCSALPLTTPSNKFVMK